MPPELITGRDIELITVGFLSLLAGGIWALQPDGSINLVPLATFVLLAGLSFSLVWLDIRSRGGFSTHRRE